MTMTLTNLQQHLKDTGRYFGTVDGQWGKLTEAGIMTMLTDGPDTALTKADYLASGVRLGISAIKIEAFAIVEANGAGFFNGRAKILPERHRFSKLTNHRYDAMYPNLSYPKWGTLPYPNSQDARYNMLLDMVRIDVDAGFSASSYGKFQIMGENYKVCGYGSPAAFAEGMAKDEITQLKAFEAFCRGNRLLGKLDLMSSRPADCAPMAEAYNGTGYRENNYHVKLAQTIKQLGG